MEPAEFLQQLFLPQSFSPHFASQPSKSRLPKLSEARLEGSSATPLGQVEQNPVYRHFQMNGTFVSASNNYKVPLAFDSSKVSTEYKLLQDHLNGML